MLNADGAHGLDVIWATPARSTTPWLVTFVKIGLTR